MLENLPLPHDATARPGDGGDSPVAGFGNLASGPPGQDEAPIGNPNLGSTVPYIVPSAPSPDGHSLGKLDPLASLVRSESNSGDWGMPVAKGGGGLGGRTPGMRAKLAGERGGSRESEAAVERGLKWLLAHQHEDGSWHFNFDGPPCDGLCRNPGTEASTTAATALALLPFYGAGYTHKDGPYKEQVNKGVYYLASRMLISPNGGDLEEGTMYAQGLSTIALCEAYNMSKDDQLRQFAQAAINFIVYAQDKQGGGWRYFPQSPGDTSVTGWQLMALKSGQMAGLEIPSQTFILASKFLDGVQNDKGSTYGYRTTIIRPTTSAVGLLCRMYLGWNRQHPALAGGQEYLSRLGPSPTDMYFNYYATQVMYHLGGSRWEQWNKKMRDYLINNQATQGHEYGSWWFDDPYSIPGGRLYVTSLSILTLEVYYRYLPIYSTKAVDSGF